MSSKFVLQIALGGALGALARFYISGLLPVYRDFPVGTLIVNSIASFLLGYISGLMFFGYDISPKTRVFFGIGFCGSLSTFSTFSYETFVLLREGEYLKASLNVFSNVSLTLLLVFLGFMLARR
ncbi:fluoride efflux transporter CrcB [Thermococcus barophilus]|uniref:fluoride efflux transporter CrcB n=1 Tax=Thermococcus barophilus TaxID=55802 RepID=UPI00018059EE|nr:fluoride efflux transporter CrcB [Thermococcus barophilus]